ncbi:MAG: type II secretion system GspH family protein [Planctomycetaceae bacterium]|nr:type II secretion system GspH family protein [Planctomycetaceae bacterium]
MKRKAFTLVELLVVIAIIAVLVAILVPVIGNALAEARKTACLTNLKTIGGAFREYNNKNGGQFARIVAYGDPNATTYTQAATVATISVTPMNQVWQLIGAGLVPETAFKCGGDGGTNGWQQRVVADTTKPYGWSTNREFSYGIQCPFDKVAAADATASSANPAITYDSDTATPTALKPTGVLMADMLTRSATTVVAGPAGYQNHGSGLAYLTQAGNVIFHQPSTPNSVVNGDEIYADSANHVVTGGAVTLPGANTDWVILGN